MVLQREEGIGKVSEELLQEARYAVDIMVEVLWVSEVEGGVGRLCIRA